MKRIGHVIEEIVERGNLEEAFDYKVRGRVARSRTGEHLLANKDEVLARIADEISSGTWEPGPYHEQIIHEGRKERIIQSVSLVKAIALNAIMRVVEKHIDKTFIKDTAASIRGRGIHYLFRRMKRDIKNDPRGTRIVRVDDIRKFYENIPQEEIMACLRRKFKDARLLAILERCVHIVPNGLSIGLRPSQALANLLLSTKVDHVMKDMNGTPCYYRYCDDTRILSGSYHESTRSTALLHKCITDMGLYMKPCGQCYNIDDRPVDFLGYKLFGNGKVQIRKETKKRFARRWARVKSRRRRRELLGSFYGITKFADAKHLFKTITGINMKDFSEMGFAYVAQDGKKRFDEKTVPLSDIQNRKITVLDYETGIKTREGDNRYVVLFENDDLGRGKFFTNSEELKQALDYMQEQNEIPFRATVKRVTFGNGKSKYQFT